MIRTLLAAAAICAVAGPAMADTYSSHCGWKRGVYSWQPGTYICEDRYDSDRSTSRTTCNLGRAGSYDVECRTQTEFKEQPKSDFVPFDAGAYARAKAREIENEKDGWHPGRHPICDPHKPRFVNGYWEPTCHY
jgi:hypothetical protein